MKRILCILLFACLLAGCGADTLDTTPPTDTLDTTPQTTAAALHSFDLSGWTLTAQQYFVYDCESAAFLSVSGSADDRIYPASVTKLFTAYVAMEFLSPEAAVICGDALDLVHSGSSVAELKKGDTLTAGQLVEAMLLPSGNDAAYVLAAEAGRVILGETVSDQAAINAFVEEMNRQAKLLGMENTHFANPDGIHSDSHYTTFSDLPILGMLAMEDPTVTRYAAVASDTVSLASGEKTWHNTNAIIDPASPYYSPYAIGLKTGQTPRAGSCLLSAFEVEGRTLLIGVFGCPEEDDRFPDTLLLLQQTME